MTTKLTHSKPPPISETGPLSLDVASRCADAVASVADYKQWTRDCIRPVFPHGMLLSGYGYLHAGGVSLDWAVGVDFAWEYLSCINNRAGAPETPVLRRFLATHEPQLFPADGGASDVPLAWLECFRRYDMRNVAAHGQLDEQTCVATYHSFYRISPPLGLWHAQSLKRLVPLMHRVLCRVIADLRAESVEVTGLVGLSSREREIVDAVRQGLSNLHIAARFGVSENTVKHHLTSIFGKLQVGSRGQLIHKLHLREMQIGNNGPLRRL